MRLVKAAKVSARKNRIMKNWPNGTRANSCGIQMNVSPSLPVLNMVRWMRSADSCSPPSTASDSAG